MYHLHPPLHHYLIFQIFEFSRLKIAKIVTFKYFHQRLKSSSLRSQYCKMRHFGVNFQHCELSKLVAGSTEGSKRIAHLRERLPKRGSSPLRSSSDGPP